MAKSGVIDWSSVDFAGRSIDDLASELGVNCSSVSKARKRLGIVPSAPRRLGDRSGVTDYALRQAQEAAQCSGQPIPQTLQEAKVLSRRRAQVRKQRCTAASRASKRLEDIGTVGCVYFIGTNDAVKIGWTRRPIDMRLSEIQKHCPVDVKVMLVLKEQTAWHERRLHERFKADWMYHEWFRASDGLMSYIRGQATPPQGI